MEIEAIYREVAPRLQSYLIGRGCSYATACDIVQETFLRLWKRRDELSGDMHRVSGLVFTIARNYRNDLTRKAQREVVENETDEAARTTDGTAARAVEELDETEVLKRRLKSALGRMAVQLLEVFVLSRLGKLSVKDIASGTETSEANVKVRVHRAKTLFKAFLADRHAGEGGRCETGGAESAVLKAVMMLAAVDGEISREELSLYRQLAQEIHREDEAGFGMLWENSIRSMAYIGFLSEMLPPEELVLEYVRETGDALVVGVGQGAVRRIVAALRQMAAADGNCSRIECECIAALATIAEGGMALR